MMMQPCEESNGLENFNLDAQDPQLFDESQNINSDNETNVNEDNDTNDEDELEIPAFLRRQKKLMVFEKINECHYFTGKNFSLSGTSK